MRNFIRISPESLQKVYKPPEGVCVSSKGLWLHDEILSLTLITALFHDLLRLEVVKFYKIVVRVGRMRINIQNISAKRTCKIHREGK